MYVGTMSTLPVGGARYGILINENGVVFDDGIVARLAPDHFWVNTTSGGAERVALAFEEWLQDGGATALTQQQTMDIIDALEAAERTAAG